MRSSIRKPQRKLLLLLHMMKFRRESSRKSVDAMDEIAKARKSGHKVIGELVVSVLILDDPDVVFASN